MERDLPAILMLMREFAEYENLAAYFDVTETKLREAMFGKNAFVEGLIAACDGAEGGLFDLLPMLLNLSRSTRILP